MTPTLGKERFLAAVRKLKEHIRAGDIFQAVLSETFHVKTAASPARLCRLLAGLGAPPYLFWLKDGQRHLIGASPERLIKVENGRALNCPIAGTRPRGATRAKDLAFERALLKSPKERAEHLMLVDLARNDLGRVSAPGTVKVRDFLSVRRFPNVMHIVSEVEGVLERGKTAWQALAASFPAGTVSGAPKVRAMELLSGFEISPRGFYAGAVLQHDFSGNLDSCITIRAMGLEKGTARLQAGAGIVADSNPEREHQEILNKLLSLRRALVLAE
jgi:anthranilate synthase component 1